MEYQTALTTAFYVLLAGGLLVFPMGRKLLKWWIVGSVALAGIIIGLMFAIERDHYID
jgi:hypothetical protein